MKFLYLELKNYIGIYNGMNKDIIKIDFSKAQSNKIIIRGLNGSGKSTIMNSLSPLPESNENFINNREASKKITLSHNKIIYNIKILHEITSNGDRKTTKAYIQKTLDDTMIELNPSGNITPYKEVLYNEFGLDSNFEALSRLSTDDRGIADKSPSERKKFVNSILSELESYNNIHKTISKRASIFKSMVNRLETKIDRIGNPEKLESSYKSIENRLAVMEQDKINLTSKLSNIMAEINILDPNGQIQSSFNVISQSLKSINNELKIKNEELKSIMINVDKKEFTRNELIEDIKSLDHMILELKLKITNTETKINQSLLDREDYAKQLQYKSSKLNSLTNKYDYEESITKLKSLRKTLNEWNKILVEIGFNKDEVNLSKEEYLLGMDTLNQIKDTVSAFKASGDYKIINEVINNFIIPNVKPNIDIIMNNIENINNKLLDIKDEINEQNRKIVLMSTLKDRPQLCTIDNCKFIKNAIAISHTKPVEELQRLEKVNASLITELDKNKYEKERMIEILSAYNDLNNILRLLYANRNILNKLPHMESFLNKEVFLNRILNNDEFNDIDHLQKYVEYCDIFAMYNIYKSQVNKLSTDINIYKSNNSIIKEFNKDINSLKSKIDNIDNTSDTLRNNLLTLNDNMTNAQYKFDLYNKISIILNDIHELENNRNDQFNRYKDIENAINAINELHKSKEIFQSKLNDISRSIGPIKNDRDQIQFNLKQLEEYYVEYEEFKAKYNKIKEIKYHSSSTTGIQLIFIKLYMGNMINLANKLLSLLFDGEFYLEPFIINSKEFRIPCRGQGILNDDISSMSTGQISLISMVLSFVMLKQSSTDYNILKLDEIDAGLDSMNRVLFLNLLDKQMELLDVEQCIMISHNPELDINGCDMILLKMDESEKAHVLASDTNIIFNY